MIQNLKSEFRFFRLDCPFKKEIIQNLNSFRVFRLDFPLKILQYKTISQKISRPKKCQQTFLPKNLRKETIRKTRYQINFEEKVRPKNLWRESIRPSSFEEKSVQKNPCSCYTSDWIGKKEIKSPKQAPSLQGPPK